MLQRVLRAVLKDYSNQMQLFRRPRISEGKASPCYIVAFFARFQFVRNVKCRRYLWGGEGGVEEHPLRIEIGYNKFSNSYFQLLIINKCNYVLKWSLEDDDRNLRVAKAIATGQLNPFDRLLLLLLFLIRIRHMHHSKITQIITILQDNYKYLSCLSIGITIVIKINNCS